LSIKSPVYAILLKKRRKDDGPISTEPQTPQGRSCRERIPSCAVQLLGEQG
jgi:hypothetical protein